MESVPNAQLDQERLVARIESLQLALEQMGVEMDRLRDLAALGELASMIAHEVRNLMTPVAGYASSALKRPGDAAFTQKALTQAAQSAMQAVGVSDAILDLASAAGASVEVSAPRPVADVLDDAIDSLADRRGEVRIEAEIERGCVADIDPRALQQTLMNLLLNAIDAGGDQLTAVRITGRMAPPCSTWNTGSVVLEVTDNGPGLPAGAGPEIFEPFVTGTRDGESRSGRRAGLGLALCKRLIERHGGAIGVASQPLQGARFRLTLPALRAGE
ncbi:MAG: sensor histidine kinase [Phycisphaerales bacterium JB059]